MIVGRLQKRWTAPVYAFFKPNVSIEYIKGRCVHVFRCANTGCKQQVRRYHGTGDTKSTGNLRKHVKSCWGAEALHAADLKDSAVNAQGEVRTYRRTHDIKVAFGNVGKKTVSFSTRQHTPSETRYDPNSPAAHISDKSKEPRSYAGCRRVCALSTSSRIVVSCR